MRRDCMTALLAVGFLFGAPAFGQKFSAPIELQSGAAVSGAANACKGVYDANLFFVLTDGTTVPSNVDYFNDRDLATGKTTCTTVVTFEPFLGSWAEISVERRPKPKSGDARLPVWKENGTNTGKAVNEKPVSIKFPMFENFEYEDSWEETPDEACGRETFMKRLGMGRTPTGEEKKGILKLSPGWTPVRPARFALQVQSNDSGVTLDLRPRITGLKIEVSEMSGTGQFLFKLAETAKMGIALDWTVQPENIATTLVVRGKSEFQAK
jgi:hypothetical protein